MVRSSLSAGEVVAEKYHLISQVGVGGMGEVWRAEHLVLRSHVAIKVILAQGLQDPDIAARFVREAQAAAALRSPYVVQILDYGVDRGMPFMVMELLEGESLGARLDRQGTIPPAELSLIFTHVARAVGKAHDVGIVHRDLKPENIFLTFSDDEMIAKVLDFGIAKFQTPMPEVSASTRTGALIGTPYYMSPEQAEGRGKVDARSDIWSLGVIAFQCLTGRRPFDSDALGELLMLVMVHPIPKPSQYANVPAGFDEWFARAVCRDPAGRFQTAREAAEALQAVCGPPGANTLVAPLRPAPPAAPVMPVAAPPAMARTAEPLSHTVSPPQKSVGPLLALGLGGAVLLLGLVAIGGLFVWKRAGAKSADDGAPVVAASAAASEVPAETPAPPTPSPSAGAPEPAESAPAPAPSAAPDPDAGSARKPAPQPKTTSPSGGKKPTGPGPTKAEDLL